MYYFWSNTFDCGNHYLIGKRIEKNVCLTVYAQSSKNSLKLKIYVFQFATTVFLGPICCIFQPAFDAGQNML